MRLKSLLAGLALLTTGQAAFAQTPGPDASQAQDLANCAGAVAAVGGFDTLNFPRDAQGEWVLTMTAILARLNVEPGVEGMTGRYAASAARAHWAEQPAGAREAQAVQCRSRFGG